MVYITVWKPVPACRDIGGEPNSIVYALVPDALDMDGSWYTTFNQEVEVCLKGSGRMIFLNATVQPRLASGMPTRDNGSGYTCTTIANAGTVILFR